MDITTDLAAVTVLHDRLCTAKSVLVDDAHKTYGQIDDFGTTLVHGHATRVTGCGELESRA